ncbi:hypothetical protein TCSYLVIO_008353, partial [Trypanosoma cruzi]
MAMTMTGRVLLVCALCVLWCDFYGIASDVADVALINENNLKGSQFNAPVVDYGGNGSSEVVGREPKSELQPSDPQRDISKPGSSLEFIQPTDRVVMVVKEEKSGSDQRGKPEFPTSDGNVPSPPSTIPEDGSPPIFSSAPAAGKDPAASFTQIEDPTRDIKHPVKEKISLLDDITQSKGQSAQANGSSKDEEKPNAARLLPAATTSLTAPSPITTPNKIQETDSKTLIKNEQPSSEDVTSLQQPGGIQHHTELTNETENEHGDHTTITIQGRPSQANAETELRSHSTDSEVNNDGFQNGHEEGNGETTDNAPESDTERKEGEHKHENVKGTPVEAAAIKRKTAPAGDSDS